MTSKIEVPRELLELITRSYPRNITDHVTIRTIQTQQAVAMDELRVLLAAPTACRECMGTGGIGRLETCSECKGTGKIAALEAPRQEPVALEIPDECPHLIVFDDADREQLMFAGTGARKSALQAWEKISTSWNAHLFVRVERNSRDDRFPSATTAPLSPDHSGGGARLVLPSPAELRALVTEAARDSDLIAGANYYTAAELAADYLLSKVKELNQ